MTDSTHPETIDWNEFWTEAEGDRRRSAALTGRRTCWRASSSGPASPATSGRSAADRPRSFGCGPADPEFELGERYPDLTAYGYDTAPSIVEANREKAAEGGVENVSFDVATLPDVDVDHDGPPIGDADAFRERFGLVFAGENLLSYERIHDVLGTWPRSFWSAVEAPDEPWYGRSNPYVYVPK